MIVEKQTGVRLAHLTDIHVATSMQAIFDALEFLAEAVPVLGAVLYGIERMIRRLPPGSRIPARVIMALTGLMGSGVAVVVSRRARAGLQFILALIFNYNRSIRNDRMALLASLRDHRVDHVLITGDLTNTARREEFEQVRCELRSCDWWGDPLTVIPGNHDKIGFPRSVDFEPYFHPQDDASGADGGYPIVREIAPGIFLLGIDSCLPPHREEPWDRIFTNIRGHVSMDQITRMETIIRDRAGGFFVFAVHHPPFPQQIRRWTDHVQRRFIREPENAAEFRRVISGTKHIVLSGHDHPVACVRHRIDGIDLAVGRATGLRYAGRIAYRVYTIRYGASIEMETVDLPVTGISPGS